MTRYPFFTSHAPGRFPELRRWGLVLAILWIPTSLSAQEVTLSLARYDELRALAEPEVEPEPESMVPVAFEQAVLTITVDEVGADDEASARIEQDWRLHLVGVGWREVVLAEPEAFIAADFGDAEGRLIDGAIAVRGAGRHQLHMSSVVPLWYDETATRPTWMLQVQAPQAAVVRGELMAPAEVEEVEAIGAVLSRVIDSSAQGPGRWSFVAEPGAAVTHSGGGRWPRRLSAVGGVTPPRGIASNDRAARRG